MSAPGSGGPNGPTSEATKKTFPRVDVHGHDLPPSPTPSSPRNGRRYAVATELVYTEGNDQYNASSVPIYQVGLAVSILYTYTDENRAQHSNRPPAGEAANTTTPGPAIPRERISSDI